MCVIVNHSSRRRTQRTGTPHTILSHTLPLFLSLSLSVSLHTRVRRPRFDRGVVTARQRDRQRERKRRREREREEGAKRAMGKGGSEDVHESIARLEAGAPVFLGGGAAQAAVDKLSAAGCGAAVCFRVNGGDGTSVDVLASHVGDEPVRDSLRVSLLLYV